MSTSTRLRPSTSAPGDGSRTITITSTPALPEDATPFDTGDEGVIGTLRLRGGPRSQPRVAWGEDVVDNEGCGRKSSKICCIYHKPRNFDESSSEEESDSEDDNSDSSCEGGHHHHHHHHHAHPGRNSHNHPHDGMNEAGGPQLVRPDQNASVHVHVPEKELNAYEIMPSMKKGKRRAAS